MVSSLGFIDEAFAVLTVAIMVRNVVNANRDCSSISILKMSDDLALRSASYHETLNIHNELSPHVSSVALLNHRWKCIGSNVLSVPGTL